jgi:hypothetical protein
MSVPSLSNNPRPSWKERISLAILHYLAQPTSGYQPFASPHPKLILKCLEPGDVLLVEGNTRLSAIIKYLTQSTWSHATLYVGAPDGSEGPVGLDTPALLEAEAEAGVHLSPLAKYAAFNTRICRPFGLSKEERRKVVAAAVGSLGKQYDAHHIVDLLRYLFPYPPVPVALRRRMLAVGAGDPTRAICSTLIAQSFYSVNYPILPASTGPSDEDSKVAVSPFVAREVFHIKQTALFTPRDFDVSPYFTIINPLTGSTFDYHTLIWDGADASLVLRRQRPGSPVVAHRDIDERSFGDLDGSLADTASDPALHLRGDGCMADRSDRDVAGDLVTDEDRMLERHAGDGNGRNPSPGAPGCDCAPGEIHLRQ